MSRRILWQRIRKTARLVADCTPPTARGWLVVIASGLALWWLGYGSLDLLLFVTGIAGVSLILLASLMVTLAGLVLRRRLAHQHTTTHKLEAGSPIRTGFSAPALAWLPLVELSWVWLEPTEVEVRQRRVGREDLEEVVAHRRAHPPQIRRRFSVEDVFGLARFSWERSEPGPVLILPDAGRLRQLPVVRSLTSAEGISHPAGAPEGDRIDMRRYVPGDPVRHILWKTFARTRQLNVRVPERSVERSRKTVAYLLTGQDDEPAAAAARVALESGSLGNRWLFGTDGMNGTTNNLEQALEAIARSGSLTRTGKANGNGSLAHGSSAHGSSAHGLASFLDAARTQGEVDCIVFAPARAGVWSEEALRTARQGRVELSFVLGLDGVETRTPPPLWQRLLLEPEPPAGTPREELTRLVRQLGAAGCPALVVDRRTGRSFGTDQPGALRMFQR